MPPARKRQKVAQPEESHVESDSDLAGAAETNDQINLAKLPVRKGEKQLPAEVKSKFRKLLNNITTDHKRTTDILAAKRGPLRAIDHDEYDDQLKLEDDHLWLSDDTERLNRDTKAFDKWVEQRKKSTAFEQLWRVVPRFMHCMPPELFDGHNLEYGEDDDVTIGHVTMKNPLWSAAFSEALRQLVLHGFFHHSPKLLAIVVQYAVKLRTNDRRQWPLCNPTTDGFLDEMVAAFGSPHPNQPTKDLHKGVRQAIRTRGKIIPPMSLLFRELEVIILTPQDVSDASADPFNPYKVTTADLKSVVKALDKTNSSGARLYLPAELNFAWIKGAMRNNDPPAKEAGVTKALKKWHQLSRQRVILKQRRPVADPASEQEAEAGAQEVPNPANGQGNAPERQGDGEADAIRITHIQQLEAEGQKLRARIQELEHDRNQAHQDWPDEDGYYGDGGVDGPSPEREDSVPLLEAVNEPKRPLSVAGEPFDLTGALRARPVVTPKRLSSVVLKPFDFTGARPVITPKLLLSVALKPFDFTVGAPR